MACFSWLAPEQALPQECRNLQATFRTCTRCVQICLAPKVSKNGTGRRVDVQQTPEMGRNPSGKFLLAKGKGPQLEDAMYVNGVLCPPRESLGSISWNSFPYIEHDGLDMKSLSPKLGEEQTRLDIPRRTVDALQLHQVNPPAMNIWWFGLVVWWLRGGFLSQLRDP